MRVLHVVPFYGRAAAFGGIARASAGLCREQARRGHHVTVATTLLRPGEPLVADEHGIRVVRFPAPGVRRLIPFAIGLRAFLGTELARTDVVHLHGHRHGLALTTAAACRRTGRPYVLQPHGTAPDHGQRRLAKWIFDAAGGRGVLAGAAERLAVSDAEARDLGGRARVVGNGVEAPARARGPRRDGPPRVLFVGNGTRQKRGHLLPRVLALLHPAELTLVGRGTEGLRQAFAWQPFTVRVAGALEDDGLWAAYEDADLVIQPAVGEAFGLSAFEAALLGTPAVVAGGHGGGEWFGAAGGCVVPPDDVEAMAAAAARRLRDPVLAQGEAAAVARFAREHLTWARVADAVDEAYVAARTSRP